ncbi:MAG: ribonuclease HII [Elusimicrobia bacterium RIFOXYD2_FULL_34_15]|nr:MAG: ribonuclease HII [Elusimicrobia bacterium RIFOXYD2_FULL_34_15]
MKELWDFDKSICPNGILAGIDEAGRGPLAGPVVSAVAILKKNIIIENLNDSKKLSPSMRLSVYKQIIENCIEYQVGIVEHSTIDRINILEATKLSMKIAVEKLVSQPELVIIDGNQPIDIKTKQKTIISGDAKSASIAAASVIAKVTRDLMMEEFDKKYPNYGFAKHKGYGTKSHISAIKKFGPCEIHRRSFEPVKSYDPIS